MIFPEVSTTEWIKKYPSLKILELPCNHCGNTLKSIKPFVTKGYAGLVSPLCDCGYGSNQCMIRVTTDINTYKKWMNVLENFL